MQSPGVIDRFLDIFARYIDSGFGLIAGDVGFLATSLIVIDVTLAFLFWTWGEGDDVLARLVKKTLQVGFFAFLLTNWNALAQIIYLSFSGLGLRATGAGSPDDLLHPGRIAQVGLDAGRPLLDQASELAGPVGLFTNFAEIAVLLLAWAIVLLAFFIIAIQIFVTLIEFKLVTLAGFVLVPFGLFGRTAFLAERVLGNVMATGVKVLVLAIIIGIGSTIFDEFVQEFGGVPPTLEQVGSLALASLTLLGLSIFGPGIAAGLISGGPQLGAGAAVGTGLVATGVGAVVGAGAAGAASLASSGAKRASGSTPSRSTPSPHVRGGSPSSPSAPPATTGGAPAAPLPSGASGSGGGSANAPAAPAPASSASAQPASGQTSSAESASNNRAEASEGAPEPLTPTAPTDIAPASANMPAPEGAPAWATRLRRQQMMTQGATLAAHSLRAADHGGGSAHISLEDRS
ncbi:type IV secretion system protein TrbL [Sphingopyxis sp. YR583]|uniref:P-type conjugative transfer protein TrbL n=1 Tax=Sphingopyxis sp. YR583 TaxID=1881047 RepID=UPI0008A72FEC|nr:P-type conjugative transfer protein TrbL [Sphingopyxis sp. YR583]SEH15013.1 type IV secretion system protein TrbL [Sphingopyxis sp. YR583]